MEPSFRKGVPVSGSALNCSVWKYYVEICECSFGCAIERKLCEGYFWPSQGFLRRVLRMGVGLVVVVARMCAHTKGVVVEYNGKDLLQVCRKHTMFFINNPIARFFLLQPACIFNHGWKPQEKVLSILHRLYKIWFHRFTDESTVALLLTLQSSVL